jgi:hypothetical protein
VDIRGRSRTLRVNYRTSHQIRTQADRLLGPGVTDVDGNAEDRSDTVSVFNGPPPMVRSLESESEEKKIVGNWIADQAKAGVMPHEFGVFVRTEAELDRAQAAVKEAGMAFRVLDEHVETTTGHVSICTMHLAKGLEFRAVAVMACDDEIIPLQERIETVGDDADLQEVYDTERHLLYVACTERNDHVNVGEMLEDVAAALHPTSDQIRVIMDPARHQTFLHTNLELWTVALRNLFENALQHMPNGGTARWSVQKGSGRLLIALEDEGPGIPDEELSLVANRFFRGRHRSASGSGLGLAIVELALRRLNASLTLKNRTDRTGLRAEVSMGL